MPLDEYAVAVVDFVLDDLGRVAGERFGARGERLVKIIHADAAPARGGARARKGEAALLGLVLVGALDDDRVVHEPCARAVLNHDDALALPDHVRRHADALVRMRRKGVEQVLADRGVLGSRVGARHTQHDGGGDDGADHGRLLEIANRLSVCQFD